MYYAHLWCIFYDISKNTNTNAKFCKAKLTPGIKFPTTFCMPYAPFWLCVCVRAYVCMCRLTGFFHTEMSKMHEEMNRTKHNRRFLDFLSVCISFLQLFKRHFLKQNCAWLMYACDNRGTHTHTQIYNYCLCIWATLIFFTDECQKNNKLSILQLLNPLCVSVFGGYKQLTCVGTLDLSTKTQSTIKIVI